MSVTEREIRINNADVNMSGKIRTSSLFTLMAEISGEHTENCGQGQSALRAKGLIWVLVKTYVEINRMPRYGETVKAESWAAKGKMILLPRHFCMTDESGNTLVSSSSVWVAVDANERKAVLPEEYGIYIPTDITGKEISLPPKIQKSEDGKYLDFTVPFSYTDSNGHMNNARYIDLAEDIIFRRRNKINPKKINVEYSNELKCGETVGIFCTSRENTDCISGYCGGKHCFSIVMEQE